MNKSALVGMGTLTTLFFVFAGTYVVSQAATNELVKSGSVAAGFTIGIFVAFVATYWAFRGFLPGSRVVELPLVAPNALDDSSAEFTLFHVKWCPYSREAVEKFELFSGLVDQYTYGGKKVHLKFIDCESQKDKCSLYKIDAYPTYKLETSSKMYEYVGPASLEAYREFLRSALGQEVAHE